MFISIVDRKFIDGQTVIQMDVFKCYAKAGSRAFIQLVLPKMCSCVAQWVSIASLRKGCGFDSQGTHVLMKMYNLNAIVSRFG